MMQVDPNPTDTPKSEAVQTAVHDAGNAMQQGVEAVAAETLQAVDRSTAFAQDFGREAARAYDDASAETAAAFDQARDRLQHIDAPGLETSEAMVHQFRTGADQLSQRFSASFDMAAKSMAEFNAKAVQAWRANAEAAIAHWQSMAGATSWADLIALNTAHARKQMEAMAGQSRELGEIAGRIVREGAETIKR